MSPHPLLRGSLVVVVLALSSSAARAQRGIDADTFHPALDPYGIFSVERSDSAEPWRVALGLWVDHAQSPLRLDMTLDPPTGKPRSATVIERQTALLATFALGLTRWLQLMIDLPVSAQAYGDAYGRPASFADPARVRSGFYAGSTYDSVAPPDASLLDWRLGFKARFWRRHGIGLALLAVVTVPMGDDAAFLGDSGFSFRPTLAADWTRGNVTVALNVGAIVRPETIVWAPADPAGTPMRSLLDVGHELTLGLGARYRFVRWLSGAIEAYSLVPLEQRAAGPLDAPRDVVTEVLAGLQAHATTSVSFSLGAGASVLRDARRGDDFRVFFGVTWARPPERSDGADFDHDGVPDAVDQCPEQAEDRDGFADDDGCPDPDNDGDGIPDAQDRCPNEPEDRDGFADDDGCPDVDNDGDRIPDAQDRCPNEPEDRDGFADDDGCPDLDNDGDGIPDAIDRCPNEAETRNGIDDEDGCPESQGAPMIDLALVVTFASGDARPSAASLAAIDTVARRLQANAAVRRVGIEGHADDFGRAHARNQALSQARAERVRELLIQRGVMPDRLQAVGYGDTRPRDHARDAAARGSNRRVEFVAVEQ